MNSLKMVLTLLTLDFFALVLFPVSVMYFSDKFEPVKLIKDKISDSVYIVQMVIISILILLLNFWYVQKHF